MSRFDIPPHIAAELEAAGDDSAIIAVLTRHLAKAHGAIAAILDVAAEVPDGFRNNIGVLRLIKAAELAAEQHGVRPAAEPPASSSSAPN